MKFVLIFGPQAVGKMTVGQELAQKTQLKLFHNHMTLELLSPIFGFGPETWRLSDLFRFEVFKAVANSDLEGMIFTYVWAFNEKDDWAFVDKLCTIFEEKGAEIYFVELEADIDERKVRNKSPNRLAHKPSKRDLEWSDNELKSSMNHYRLNSFAGEITRKNFIKINNTNLGPKEVAVKIKEKFGI
ncbi:AAA family ATPase [Mesobacillus maritimus]|uniref:AAA family ATPase n=1 Tax=Mesobacillus maritimus TaxID=1643336 RepID=A0ABS7K087_9BACI|nr:AAA family ATPase [Mesobacillus maritimus]MBY0095566.1 AAA family ATPase [Mesobacillus maritimus]